MSISELLDFDFKYCTVDDHKMMRENGFLSCCRCGGSTAPIDIPKWADRLADDVWRAND